MKKYILPIIALALLLSGTASAQNTGIQSSSTIKMMREKLQQEKASTTASIKNQKANIKSQMEKLALDRMNMRKNEVVKEFDNAMSSLNNLINRTSSRISKMTLQNIEVASSTALLNITKTNTTSAQTEVNTLKNLVAQITSTTTPKILKAQIKTQSTKTKTAIQLAKKSISETSP